MAAGLYFYTNCFAINLHLSHVSDLGIWPKRPSLTRHTFCFNTRSPYGERLMHEHTAKRGLTPLFFYTTVTVQRQAIAENVIFNFHVMVRLFFVPSFHRIA